MAKYRVGIIGCGDIGFHFDYNKKINGALTHFKAFRESKHFEVAAVAEKKVETGNLIKKKFKVAAYENFERMLEENELDVIVVATNDESHFEILNKVIRYEPKLVFCEKPVALSCDEAKSIVSLYEKNGISLQVNFTRRFMKEFADVKQIIDGKKIGEIESIAFYYSRGLIHNASHYLDLVNWYIGETEKNIVKTSVKKGLNDDDTISFNLTYSNGTEVRFTGLNPSKLSFAEIDIVGTNGRIRVNYNYEIEKYVTVKNKLYPGYSMYKLKNKNALRFTNALPNAVENSYRTLEGKENLRAPAKESIKIFELINRIKEAPLCQS